MITIQDKENNRLYAECTILDFRFRKRFFRNQRAFETALQTLRNGIGKVKIFQQKDHRDISVTIPPFSDSSASCSSSSVNKIERAAHGMNMTKILKQLLSQKINLLLVFANSKYTSTMESI